MANALDGSAGILDAPGARPPRAGRSRATGVLLAAALAGGALAPAGAVAQRPAGVPGADATAFEFVGRMEQVGGDFVLRAYLTHLAGVPDRALFTRAGDQTEATARITLVARARLRTRAVLDNIFVVTASGRADFHLRPAGGASFAAPASFSGGRRIGSSRLRMQSILNVQSPDRGIATINGSLVQSLSARLRLGGARYRFGRVGQATRVVVAGQGVRTEPTLPRATIVMAGSATVAR